MGSGIGWWEWGLLWVSCDSDSSAAMLGFLKRISHHPQPRCSAPQDEAAKAAAPAAAPAAGAAAPPPQRQIAKDDEPQLSDSSFGADGGFFVEEDGASDANQLDRRRLEET